MAPIGRLVVNNAVMVNGAFEAPVPEPDGWLVLDADSNQVSLERLRCYLEDYLEWRESAQTRLSLQPPG